MRQLNKRDLMKVGLRLILLQSSWSDGAMQSVGFTYCLIPGFRVLYPDNGQMNAALRRYQEPFNSHPFLVGVIAGMTLRFEEEGKGPEEIAAFKRSAMSLLAALGDPFFRNAFPALVAVVACLAAVFGGALAGIITLVVLFNAVHLFVRLAGVLAGYRDGASTLKRVAFWLSPARTGTMKYVSAFGAGTLMVAVARAFGPPSLDQSLLLLAVTLGGVLASLALNKWRQLQQYTVPIALAAIVIIEVTI